MPGKTRELPDVATLLAAAVAGIGGAERPGQVTMALAVGRAMDTGEHLAVQAGTGCETAPPTSPRKCSSTPAPPRRSGGR